MHTQKNNQDKCVYVKKRSPHARALKNSIEEKREKPNRQFTVCANAQQKGEKVKNKKQQCFANQKHNGQ
jgi:hypothetical protein